MQNLSIHARVNDFRAHLHAFCALYTVAICFYLHFLVICSAHSLPLPTFFNTLRIKALPQLWVYSWLQKAPAPHPDVCAESSSRGGSQANEDFLLVLPTPLQNDRRSSTCACALGPFPYHILRLLPSTARSSLLLSPDKHTRQSPQPNSLHSPTVHSQQLCRSDTN